MFERKILLLILAVIIYCFYCVHMWKVKYNDFKENNTTNDKIKITSEVKYIQQVKRNTKSQAVPINVKDACSVLEIFIVKPPVKFRNKRRDLYSADNNTIAKIGITAFLIILVLNALIDVIKVREENKVKRKLNPDGERRQSLSDFANKKTLRRGSSKFSLQLFQIAETIVTPEEIKRDRQHTRPYYRGDSTHSYLSDRKVQQDRSISTSANESPSDGRLVKHQSASMLLGARPTPLVRRSSFPALPLNPDVQALMLGHRQASLDSDDEIKKRRRVRILRRY